MGVSQGIADGLMGRCAMKWSTAGTNRVCSRCLTLKDTIVGYTDEIGVTIPPLHPRCRCAIIYDEVAAPRRVDNKPNKPSRVDVMPSSAVSSTNLIPRTLEEAKAIADKLNPIVGKYFVRKSKWSGRVEITPRRSNCKLPSCALGILLKDCPDEAILHELVHAHSTSYYPNEIYVANSAIEEASVQFLTQEIAKRERIDLVGSNYDYWVENLREINKRLKLYNTDLKFAQRLLRVPMAMRMEWLTTKAREKIIEQNGTIEQMAKVIELLDKITWETLDNELP